MPNTSDVLAAMVTKQITTIIPVGRVDKPVVNYSSPMCVYVCVGEVGVWKKLGYVGGGIC